MMLWKLGLFSFSFKGKKDYLYFLFTELRAYVLQQQPIAQIHLVRCYSSIEVWIVS